MTSITLGSPRPAGRSKRYLVAAGGAALAIATLAGVATQRTHRDHSGTVVETAPVASSVVTQAQATIVTGPSEVVYLVGSHEQADAVQAAIDEAGNLTAQLGTSQPSVRVLVAGDDGTDFIVNILTEMKLPGISLIDLRSRMAGDAERVDASSREAIVAADGTAGHLGGLAEQMQARATASTAPVIAAPQPRPVLYIVATEEDAAQVRAGFEMFAPTTRQYHVLVLTPADDDRILSGLYTPVDPTGVPPVDIIDLRGR